MDLRPWFRPGIGIKRWLLVVFAGMLLLALGVAHLIRQATRDLEPGGVAGTLLDLVTLQFLPHPLRGLAVGLLGALLVTIGAIRVMRVVMDPLRPGEGDRPLVDMIYAKRFLSRGPRIVTIGGGTGLSTLLRGLKGHTSNLTAVVTVADDGGSSGVLRTELGIPPVGDLRNCIAALADAEPLMHQLLQYRFPSALDAETPGGAGGKAGSDPPRVADGPGLAGHALGNLIIAAMAEIEGGDFEQGVRHINRILAVRGRVVPVSASPLVLHARLRDGAIVDGQSRIVRTEGIERVWVTPDDVAATTDALAAIAEADLVVLGPGSLFTSLLPSLLIPEIRTAVLGTGATRLYVCNVATQDGETAGFDLADHVEALIAHTSPDLVDLVLANDRFTARVPPGWGAEPVRLRWPPSMDRPPRLVLDDVVDGDNAHHHDAERLAAAIVRILGEVAPGHRRAVGRTA